MDPCLFAYLDVFDGENKNSTKIGQACGSKIPLPFVSTGNALFLNYKTSWTHQSSLQITYSSVTSACGGEFYGGSGNFASPGYPGGYPTNVECVWILKSAPGNLTFKKPKTQTKKTVHRKHFTNDSKYDNPSEPELQFRVHRNSPWIRDGPDAWPILRFSYTVLHVKHGLLDQICERAETN